MKKVIAVVLAVATNAVFAALPTEYQQLEYIKATGNCQVRTGVTPASTDKVPTRRPKTSAASAISR